MKKIKNPTIYIFGATNVDFVAQKETFIKKTSNICNITTKIGGVGYNIFQGIPIEEKKFVTIIGDDNYSQEIVDKFNHNQVYYQKIKGIKNNIYISFMEDGKLLYSAVDSKVSDISFSEDFITPILNSINNDDFVIIDANLPKKTHEFILNHTISKKSKIFFETVSVEKTKKVKPIFKNIYLTTPTSEELNILVGSEYNSEQIFKFMFQNNVENILLTEGKKGVKWFSLNDNTSTTFRPYHVLNLSDTNSAGDYFLASLIEKLYYKEKLHHAIKEAMIATENFLLSKNGKNNKQYLRNHSVI